MLKLLTAGEFSSLVDRRGWIEVDGARLRLPTTAKRYATTFEACGIVGADLSEIFLNEVLPERIDGGLFQIVAIQPNSPNQTAIISHMLASSGHGPMGLPPIRIHFESDYLGLAAAMTWAIACDWEFDFVSDHHHFLVQVERHQTIIISWDETVTPGPKANAVLSGLQFTPVRTRR